MTAFTAWIMSLLGIVVIGTILDIFLAEKKMGKQIRSVLAALVVLMIISPIPALITGLQGCSLEVGDVNLDENFLHHANRIKVESLERGLERALADEGFSGVRVQITAQIDVSVRISLVTLNIEDMVLASGIPSANRVERVRGLTADFLRIGREQILVFG